ncbi:MAG: DUF5050 domain-containing protein, partial [Clostridiaceae bacterium]|nr:DUF5050 domain-containing protein [Clostridiaceae bacterium]
RTLVPARFVAESLGAKVEWEDSYKVVVITSEEKLADSEEVINFKDIKLEEVIREVINKPEGDLTKGDVQTIISLNAQKKDISDLDGIENLKNLLELFLFDNNIRSIECLKEIKNLTVLDLWGNRIQDIGSLRELTGLNVLDLACNQIIDISPLEKLDEIRKLSLYDNSITDITVLKELDSLYNLYLEDSKKTTELNDELFDSYDALNEKVNSITESLIKPGMSELDKELALHDYIILNCKYDVENYEKNTVPIESHSHIGVFMKGVAVCDGYAKAMHILLSRAGIESQIITGEAVSSEGWENHAWNIVKIEGKYYHLDVTHDDPSLIMKSGEEESRHDVLRHNFFNLSDAQICSNHKWDRELYEKCDTDNEAVVYKSDRRHIRNGEWVYANLVGKLYKIKTDGTEYVELCEDNAEYLDISEDWVFYSNNSDEGKLYKIRKDGSERTKINDDTAIFIRNYRNSIFYINSKDHSLYKLEPDNTKIPVVKYNAKKYLEEVPRGKSVAREDFFVLWMDISEEVIYYTCFKWNSGNKLYNKDIKTIGKDPEMNEDYNIDLTCLFDTNSNIIAGVEYINDGESIRYSHYENIFIVGDWIYYLDGEDNNSINKMKKDASENMVIVDGKCTDMEIVGDWIYYFNTEDRRYYKVKLDGTMAECLQNEQNIYTD